MGHPYAKPSHKKHKYGSQWNKLRTTYMMNHPMCEVCNKQFAEEVHHIIPVLENPDLKYTVSNLQAVCRQCHYEIHKRNRNESFPEDI